MAMVLALITDCLVLLFQVTGILLEAFFLFLLLRFSHLRKNSALRLIQFLVASDLMCAILTTPYSVFLIYFWTPVLLDYDPKSILLLSIENRFHQKVNLVLTISIALDRITALFFPVHYRTWNQNLYSNCCLLVALLAGGFDAYIGFQLTTFQRHPGCPSAGCFVDATFLPYWGSTNMALGCLKIALTAAILIKLHMMGETAKRLAAGSTKYNRFQQANHLTIGVLAVSLTFITCPSVFVGIVEMFGFSAFSKLGPFYLLGLIIAGNGTPIIYLLWHSDIRRSARKMIYPNSVTTFSQNQSSNAA